VSARIAVVVPCHDDGALLGETLASLREPEPLEIVVVDDASSDPATLALLERLREEGVRVERHDRNQGLSAARMTGVRASGAPFVFPLDSDDLAVPGALVAMADRLEREPRAAVCFGDYEEFGDQRRLVRVPRRLDPYRIAYRNEYPVSSLFRRDALLAAGGWRDVGGEVGYEDWNLWMTLAERGAEGVHLGPGLPIYRRRLHGTRMLTGAAARHRLLYGKLRELHPALFGALDAHRRRSEFGRARRILYPLAYGARPPLGLVTRLRRLRDRARARGQSGP
jgi:glycosyltransferase involved in cell wall biosynthesis